MRTVLALLVVALAGLSACGGDDGGDPAGGRPTVVVTTNILGDVVEQMLGEAADVEVLMPVGADPHDFAPSARQAADVRAADALVVNGLGFEAALLDTIEAAEADGVRVIAAAEAITALPFDGEPDAGDPHLFSDPVRMAEAAAHIADELAAALPALDTPGVRARVDAYLADLGALDAEVEALLAPIPPARRVLVTNHEVFAYFADRYGFEVLGAVVPGGSTLAEPSAADLADLADLIETRDVPAIFADTSSPARVLAALAAEGADVEVVELYSESLGEAGSGADTYVGMVRTNAARIAAALG
jgi:zinc/manganese transport system substrate-binding protein